MVDRRACRLQDVEALHDEDVRLAHDDLLARDDVVRQVRVDGRADLLVASLHLREEAHERAAVERLREALALHEPTPLQLAVGQEEAVGRHELDAGRLGPPRHEVPQDARRRRLADSHRASDADHVRRDRRALPQEGRRRLVETARRAHVEVEEA